MRIGLFGRLFAAFAVLIGCSAVLAWALASGRIAEDVRAEALASLRAEAGLLADVARPLLEQGGDPTSLQERVKAAARLGDSRYTVITLDGKVVADSQRDPTTMEPHTPTSRPELALAEKTGEGTHTRTSDSVHVPMIYVALRVDSGVDAGGAPKGYVRAGLALLRENERLARLRGDIAQGAAIAAGIALLLAGLLARRVSRPLRTLTDAAGAIAAGDYGRRVPAASRDEVGKLAAAFNGMGEQMQERMETISRERRELRALLSGMVEGVVAVDRDERVVLVNEAAGRILGSIGRPAEGRPIWEVTRLKEVGETLAEAVRTGSPQVREARLPRSPRDQHLRLHAAPLRDGGGAGAGAVLVLHDVSEQRHLERVRRDFVANVSHELKTPLAAVRGFAETILDDEAMVPDTRRRFLQRIREHSLRLTEMVEELLALSRVESAENEIARAPTDLRGPVRDGLQSQAGAAGAKRLVVRMEAPEDAVLVLANDEALSRITGNLLDNAVKYTPAGGRITVRVLREGREVLLEVEDTGPGIPEQDRERVFERFYRVDKGRSRDAGGTGLGLAIVKHFVRALGGGVAVEAAPGGGSLFRVRLPAA